MKDFLQVATAYPTALLSLIVLASTVYWVVSLLGGFGIDGLEDASDSAADADGEGFLGSITGYLHLDAVPVTVALTLWMTGAWFTSFVLTTILLSLDLPGVLFYLLGTLSLLLSLVVGVFLAIPVTRPLSKLYRATYATNREGLVGAIGTVTTGTVSPSFGQAEVPLPSGGTSLVQVRCDEDPAPSSGSKVVLLSFDEERDGFVVSPVPESFTV